MITLLSFGFKNGIPPADAIVDCRGLRNPHDVLDLRPLTGLDQRVQEFVARNSMLPVVMKKAWGLLNACSDGDKNVVMAFGCHGGRHRSVACAELFRGELLAGGGEVEVRHRDLSSK